MTRIRYSATIVAQAQRNDGSIKSNEINMDGSNMHDTHTHPCIDRQQPFQTTLQEIELRNEPIRNKSIAKTYHLKPKKERERQQKDTFKNTEKRGFL